MKVLAVACKQCSGTSTFPGSGAGKRFATSVNQVQTAKNKIQAAKRLGNMTR